MNDALGELLGRVHPDIAEMDHGGSAVPCIILSEERFDKIMQDTAGRAVSVDTNLNILQDGLGHVFVEIDMTFSLGGIREKILLNAGRSVRFFELLVETSMLALSGQDPGRVFMIQLPRPERASDALRIIREGLKLCSRRDSNPGPELGKLEY